MPKLAGNPDVSGIRCFLLLSYHVKYWEVFLWLINLPHFTHIIYMRLIYKDITILPLPLHSI